MTSRRPWVIGRWSLATVAVGAIGLVSGCSSSVEDFSTAAEEFLRSDEVFAAYGVDFADPVCGQPTDIEPDATFTCTADGEGVNYEFTMRITGDHEVILDAITPSYPDA